MQQELDTLQNERRDLKEQLRKKYFANVMLNRQDMSQNESKSSNAGSNVATVESPALVEELKQVKNLNRILQKNCVHLRECLSKKMLADLPLLPKSSSKLPLKEMPFENKPTKQEDNINSLVRNSNDLMKVNKQKY